MDRATEQKFIVITQKTRLEQLIHRYNYKGQAKFYIESHGGNFTDYEKEDTVYHDAVSQAVQSLQSIGRVQVFDREFLPRYIFGADDIVIAIGRDGLVVNVLKYLTTQKLIGVNPDPNRWDGVLLPFEVGELSRIALETIQQKRSLQHITFAQAVTNDGQKIYGVNDLFIGQRTHTSAWYEISLDGKQERQCSSGVICSTGMGKTGWLQSILKGAEGISRYCGVEKHFSIDSSFNSSSERLYFTVREPFPSKATGTNLIFGEVTRDKPLQISSLMSENGVIFSDGMEADYLEFNSGSTVTIGIADKKGCLVI